MITTFSNKLLENSLIMAIQLYGVKQKIKKKQKNNNYPVTGFSHIKNIVHSFTAYLSESNVLQS